MRDEGQRDGIQREGDEVECKSKLKHEKQKNEKKKESAGGFFPPPTPPHRISFWKKNENQN